VNMNQNTLVEQLRELKLSSFFDGIVEQRTSQRYMELPFEERLTLLLDRECLRRSNDRLVRRIRSAAIKHSTANLDSVDLQRERGLSKQRLVELGTCRWVRDRLSLVVTGPTGVGKSFVASALADQACRLSLTAFYTRASDLIADLLLSKSDGSYRNLRKRLARVDLLIIDDFLRDPLEAAHAREFLDLIDDRFRTSSCIFVSQLPISDWYKNIVEPTVADAILDRIVHDALRVELTGESMRKRTSTVPNHPGQHVASLRVSTENLNKKKEGEMLT